MTEPHDAGSCGGFQRLLPLVFGLQAKNSHFCKFRVPSHIFRVPGSLSVVENLKWGQTAWVSTPDS